MRISLRHKRINIVLVFILFKCSFFYDKTYEVNDAPSSMTIVVVDSLNNRINDANAEIILEETNKEESFVVKRIKLNATGNGEYTTNEIRKGNCRIVVRYEELSYLQELNIDEDEMLKLNIQLNISGSIKGKINNIKDDITYQVYIQALDEYETIIDNAFEFKNVPFGEYYLSLTKNKIKMVSFLDSNKVRVDRDNNEIQILNMSLNKIKLKPYYGWVKSDTLIEIYPVIKLIYPQSIIESVILDSLDTNEIILDNIRCELPIQIILSAFDGKGSLAFNGSVQHTNCKDTTYNIELNLIKN